MDVEDEVGSDARRVEGAREGGEALSATFLPPSASIAAASTSLSLDVLYDT